jgi:hypothetical protein
MTVRKTTPGDQQAGVLPLVVVVDVDEHLVIP